MSARSNNYNAQDNRTLAFLHNYFIQNTTQSMIYDFDIGMYLPRTQPQDLLDYNRQYQIAVLGQYTPGSVEITSDSFTGPAISGLPTSAYNYFAILQAWPVYNFYNGFNPPRDKYNVRRTYWTGKPRKRMNL